MKMTIHIGARKTGTTTIQNVLKKNISHVRQAGLFISNISGSDADNIFPGHFMSKRDFSSEWDAWAKDLLDGKDAGCDRALISAESLTDLKEDEILDLKNFLDPHSTDYEIVFYVRRQDVVATSHYSTGLRGGGVGDQLMSMRMGARGIRGFRYKKTADAWASIFGKSAINVRVFPDPRSEGWDVVEDFLPLVGLQRSHLVNTDRTFSNTRLSARQAAYLRQLNLKLEADARKHAPILQREFLKFCPDLAEGPKVPKPSRSMAEEFYDNFRQGNENLRKSYLKGSDHPIFNESFEDYPDEKISLDSFFDPDDFVEKFSKFRESWNSSRPGANI